MIKPVAIKLPYASSEVADKRKPIIIKADRSGPLEVSKIVQRQK